MPVQFNLLNSKIEKSNFPKGKYLKKPLPLSAAGNHGFYAAGPHVAPLGHTSRSGKHLHRCNFARSTTLPAGSTLSGVGIRVISVENHGFHAVGPLVVPLGHTSPLSSSLENFHIGVTF